MTDHTDIVERQYVTRDTEAQGEFYLRHIGAMTGEGLHRKSDIAAELAHRDMEITRLRAEAEALRNALEGLLTETHKSDVDGNGWVCSPIHVDELNAAINATKGAT
jgi:hypothetical protein